MHVSHSPQSLSQLCSSQTCSITQPEMYMISSYGNIPLSLRLSSLSHNFYIWVMLHLSNHIQPCQSFVHWLIYFPMNVQIITHLFLCKVKYFSLLMPGFIKASASSRLIFQLWTEDKPLDCLKQIYAYQCILGKGWDPCYNFFAVQGFIKEIPLTSCASDSIGKRQDVKEKINRVKGINNKLSMVIAFSYYTKKECYYCSL